MTQISQGKKVVMPGSTSRGRNRGNVITVVELSGKTNHFGMDITTGLCEGDNDSGPGQP